MQAHLTPFREDDTGWIVDAHARYYAEVEGFDESFAPLVARVLDGFRAAHDPRFETGIVARDADGTPLGCVFCMRRDAETAQLRLFLLLPAARGQGLGRRMLRALMAFARDGGYARIVLWTHESHRAACALYASEGWTLDTSRPVRSFGRDLVEQAWSVPL